MRSPASPSCLISRGSIAGPRSSVVSIIRLSCFPHRVGYGFGGNFEMGSVPKNLSLAQHDYLRGFVRHAKAMFDGSGQPARVLYFNQRHFALVTRHLIV